MAANSELEQEPRITKAMTSERCNVAAIDLDAPTPDLSSHVTILRAMRKAELAAKANLRNIEGALKQAITNARDASENRQAAEEALLQDVRGRINIMER